MRTFVIISCLFVVAVFIAYPVQAITGTCTLTGGTPVNPGSYACDGNVDTYTYASDTGTAGINITFPSQTWITSATVYNGGKEVSNRTYNLVYALSDSGNTTYSCEAAWGTSCSMDLAVGGEPTINASIYIVQHPGLWTNWTEVSVTGYNSTYSDHAPVVDFTGTPLNGTAPQYVSFVDNSTNWAGYNPVWNWSVDPMDGVLVAPQDLDNQDITILFTENGNFSITHGLETDYGSDILTRTDYVHIYNSTALSTFRVRAVDALSGYGVNGAEVDVFDIENSSWSNQTSVTGEVTVTALTGHTINAYGSATGYDDGESLALPVVADSLYPVYMWPSSFVANVSEGNVTVYVTVLEDGTNTRLSGISLSLTGPASGGADFTNGITNDNGIFQATIKNQSNYNVQIHPQKGHLGASKSFNSGNQSGGDAYVEVTIWLPINYVTTAPTVTTLPGGGTPTPAVTYLEYCDPNAANYDAAKCRTSKGSSGLNLLADNLENLILLCIVVTMFYLLGIRLGR